MPFGFVTAADTNSLEISTAVPVYGGKCRQGQSVVNCVPRIDCPLWLTYSDSTQTACYSWSSSGITHQIVGECFHSVTAKSGGPVCLPLDNYHQHSYRLFSELRMGFYHGLIGSVWGFIMI